MRRHVLALSLLCVLPLQAASAAETIRWPNPWKVGQVLVYDTEGLETEVDGNRREKIRDTDRTTIRITQATPDGFLQEWRSQDAKFEVIEGDQAMAGLMSAAMTAMGDLAVEVSLDKDGNSTGIRNIEAISTRLRTAMRPVMASALDAEVAKQPEDQRVAIKAKAQAHVDKVLDGLASPAVVASMLGQVVDTYNAFVGVELEAGQWYELETQLDNPMGGPKFPAKLEFALYPSESDPDDVFFEWTSTIDPKKGADAVWDMVEKLFGTPVTKAQRKGLPKAIVIEDEGFALFRRDTGVTEMFETNRTVKFGQRQEVERQRMRLVGGDHEHAWKDDEAAGEEASREEGAGEDTSDKGR